MSHDAKGDTSIGERLRARREALGMTQQELASAAGVALVSVQRAERSAAEPGGKVLSRLLSALDAAGHSLTTPGSTTGRKSATVPSTLAQMIGSLQVPAAGADPFLALVELAAERGDPPEVFARLAAARKEAPPGADVLYWMRAYLAAVDESQTADARRRR